jgi:hypothetical protein
MHPAFSKISAARTMLLLLVEMSLLKVSVTMRLLERIRREWEV